MPTVIMLDSKGRVFDWMAGGADEASLPGKVALLKEKASRVRPLTVVNDIPKGGDPREEAAAICRAMEQVPAEAWYRDYPRTMKRLEKLDCTEPSFLAAREAADRLAKNRETASLLRESFLARVLFPSGIAWPRGGRRRMIPRCPWLTGSCCCWPWSTPSGFGWRKSCTRERTAPKARRLSTAPLPCWRK